MEGSGVDVAHPVSVTATPAALNLMNSRRSAVNLVSLSMPDVIAESRLLFFGTVLPPLSSIVQFHTIFLMQLSLAGILQASL
jgi:hypothetical protein